jgi:hypothetical protein
MVPTTRSRVPHRGQASTSSANARRMRAAHVPLRLGRGSGGRLHARALGESIFTEADDVAGLHANVCDAVRCHFDDDRVPRIIRLHFVREEVITA